LHLGYSGETVIGVIGEINQMLRDRVDRVTVLHVLIPPAHW